MQITNSSEKITPFGGFNFCHKLFNDSGLPPLIDGHLGKRVKTFGFGYSDIFANHMAIFLHGGDRTEDVNEHLRGHLHLVRGFNVCSADTVLRGIKELSTETAEEQSGSKVRHQFNINKGLNSLMVKSLLQTGQLSRGDRGYTLDYDNQVVPAEKYDSKRTYKKFDGYQPGIASIGKLVVYIEGRNGNSQAKYRQAETLGRAFGNLDENGVKITRFRADSASYQKDVVELVKTKAEYFYIRAARCASMEQQIARLPATAWKKGRLGVQEMEVAEIKEYRPFGGKTAYRLVVSRIKRRDGQTGLFTGDDFTYRGILTNDRATGNLEAVAFYNERGSGEKNFDVMNNDFGWSKLPCSFLSENTAYMIMTAMYANFYQHIIATFSKKLDWLEESFRLKKFVFRFISVAGKWIRSGRRHVLKLYTKKDYRPILT
jgi:hypothetical protein